MHKKVILSVLFLGLVGGTHQQQLKASDTYSFDYVRAGAKLIGKDMLTAWNILVGYRSDTSGPCYLKNASMKYRCIFKDATFGCHSTVKNILDFDSSGNCYVVVETCTNPHRVDTVFIKKESDFVGHSIIYHKVPLVSTVNAVVNKRSLEVADDMKDYWWNQNVDKDIRRFFGSTVFYFKGLSDDHGRAEDLLIALAEWIPALSKVATDIKEARKRDIEYGKYSLDNLIQSIDVRLKTLENDVSFPNQSRCVFLAQQKELLMNYKKSRNDHAVS